THRTRWRATLQARKGIGDGVWHSVPSVYRTQCYSVMLALDLCCCAQTPRATRLDRFTAIDLFRVRPEYRTVHAMALRDRVAAILRQERREVQA
ncbi:MAG: hypothetical protein K2X42_06870, partial [Burkholderiaceae bacterium]|nr:hypothetical protein [Burkholderiaceae bacterium]